MESNEDRNNPWAWAPVVPRKLLLVSWLVFVAIALAAIGIERVAHPGQAVALTLWRAIGGNASGVSYWLILGSYLTMEVLMMVLTLRRNRYEVEKAAKAAAKAATEAAAKATTEAAAKARAEGRSEERQEWQAWYEQVKEDLENGRLPSAPPPSGRNGNEAG